MLNDIISLEVAILVREFGGVVCGLRVVRGKSPNNVDSLFFGG
jgi:hypothetical protein